MVNSLLYSREVSGLMSALYFKLRMFGVELETNPLVKTLRSDVLPHAPSPLYRRFSDQQ